MLDHDDRRFFVASIVAPLMVWWFFIGRKKYGMKGMR
jgi:hypothetical protein